MKQALTCQQSIRSPPSPPSPPLPVFVFHTSHIEIWSVTLWRKTKKQGCEARVGKKRVKSSFLCECVSVRENARHGNCRVIVKQRQTVYELRLAINPKENTNFYLSRTYAFRYWSTCHATFCYCRFIGAMSHSSCASEVYIRLKVKSTFSSVFCARTTPELCSKVVTPSERKRNCGSCEVRACVRRVCVCVRFVDSGVGRAMSNANRISDSELRPCRLQIYRVYKFDFIYFFFCCTSIGECVNKVRISISTKPSRRRRMMKKSSIEWMPAYAGIAECVNRKCTCLATYAQSTS